MSMSKRRMWRKLSKAEVHRVREQLNAVYGGYEDPEEKELLRRMFRCFSELVKDQW